MARPRALFLAPESPYPVIGGGALRAACVLEFLAQRYSVDAITFRDLGRPYDPQFPPGTVNRVTVINLPANSKGAVARWTRNAARVARGVPPLIDRFAGHGAAIDAALAHGPYDVAVIEHFWCAPYIARLRSSVRHTVCNLHNIESVWHDGAAVASTGAMSAGHRVFARASRDLERSLFPQFNLLLATSADDAARCDHANVHVVPNAIPWIAPRNGSTTHAIAFSGTLDYEPNRTAVAWFARNVWPRLAARHPDLRWSIVGRNPHAVEPFVRDSPRVDLIGPVDDAIAELVRAKVAIAPIRSGSGTRLKIIEAWAAARPVVSTKIGAEGLPVTDGENIMRVDTPDGFAEAVTSLLDSDSLRRRMGDSGRALYEREFTWQAAWRHLAAAFESLRLP